MDVVSAVGCRSDELRWRFVARVVRELRRRCCGVLRTGFVDEGEVGVPVVGRWKL